MKFADQTHAAEAAASVWSLLRNARAGKFAPRTRVIIRVLDALAIPDYLFVIPMQVLRPSTAARRFAEPQEVVGTVKSTGVAKSATTQIEYLETDAVALVLSRTDGTATGRQPVAIQFKPRTLFAR
jgi:hypothetical protein